MSVINAVANASAHQAILQMKSRIEQSNNTISDIETQISTTNDKIVSTRNEHGLTAKRINILYKQILNTWKTKHGNSKDVHDKVNFFQNTTKKMLTNSTEVCKQLFKKVLVFKRQYDQFTKDKQDLRPTVSKMSAMDTDYKSYDAKKLVLKQKQKFATDEINSTKMLTGKLQDMKKILHRLKSENLSLLPKIDKLLKEEARLELQRDTKKEQIQMLMSKIQLSTANLQNLEVSMKECNYLRRTKDSLEKALELYNLNLRASDNARFHLRNLLKSVNEIEETENHISKILIPKYEKVTLKNKMIANSRKSIERRLEELKQQVEKGNLRLSIAERQYKCMKQYGSNLNLLDLHDCMHKCNKLESDIIAACNFQKAIRSKLFLENNSPVIAIDKKINEKSNQLQSLIVPQDTTDQKNVYKKGQAMKLSSVFNQLIQHINVSAPFNDSQNSAVIVALNDLTQRDLMNLCVETSLVRARELGKQNYLHHEIASEKYKKNSIAQLETRVQNLKTSTDKIETEYKILWDFVKRGRDQKTG